MLQEGEVAALKELNSAHELTRGMGMREEGGCSALSLLSIVSPQPTNPACSGKFSSIIMELQAGEASALKERNSLREEVRSLKVREEGGRSAQRVQLQALQDGLDNAWYQALQHQGTILLTLPL